MRKKIYFLLFVVFGIAIVVNMVVTKQETEFLIANIAEKKFEIRQKEFDVLLEDKNNFLDSFAKFLASSPEIINGYLENNRSKIIDFVKPLYTNLHDSKLIEEMHFFKPPAISFVNFVNLKVHNINVSKERRDIDWVSSSFAPSTHFYICRLYPGLRATYPIVYNNSLLGSISFGMHIDNFREIFKKLKVDDVSIYLNDNDLKNSLLPQKYAFFEKYSIYKDYKVLGSLYQITLKPGYEIKNYNVYTKIEITDFFKNKIGYMVIVDDISKTIANIKNKQTTKLIFQIFSYALVLFVIFILFKIIFKKIDEMKIILDNISHQKFDKLPNKTTSSDTIESFKNLIIDVGHQIEGYINLLKKEVKDFSKKAYYDALTNAYNRAFFNEVQNEIFLKHKIENKLLCIVMLDVDGFKKINDTYGHDIGDIVLKELVDCIKKFIRKDDILIRIGGEEFIIILPNTDTKAVYLISEKIRKAVEDLSVDIGQRYINFTISLGISCLHEDDTSLSETIKRSDENLYKAKRNGKNRVEL